MGKWLLSTSHTMRFSSAKHIQPFRVWETGPVHSSLRSGTLWAQTVGLYLSRRVLQPTGANVWTLQNCCRLITHTLGWLTVALLELKSPLRKCSFSIRIRACMHAHTMSVFLSLSVCLSVSLSPALFHTHARTNTPPPHTHTRWQFIWMCHNLFIFKWIFCMSKKVHPSRHPPPHPLLSNVKSIPRCKINFGVLSVLSTRMGGFFICAKPCV